MGRDSKNQWVAGSRMKRKRITGTWIMLEANIQHNIGAKLSITQLGEQLLFLEHKKQLLKKDLIQKIRMGYG